jgi:hypothetical protein
MSALVAELVDEALKMLAIISRVSPPGETHTVRHHFMPDGKPHDPPLMPDGTYDAIHPEEIWEYIRLLMEGLDPTRYEVIALGWDEGLEAIEKTRLSAEWARTSASELCGLAERSGTKYLGWDWLSHPPGWSLPMDHT